MTHYDEPIEIREKAVVARKAMIVLINQIHKTVGPIGRDKHLMLNEFMKWCKGLETGYNVDDTAFATSVAEIKKEEKI
jgi:hypothetical protein